MHGDRGARHAKVFVNSTHKTGYLQETKLVPETVGLVAAIKDIPFAMKLVRAGKVPNPLKPHKAKKLDEVNKLNKLVGDRRRTSSGGRPRAPREATKGRTLKSSYAYYPGCLASLSQKELDTSTRAIAERLGFELVDIPGFTCCGAGDVHEARPEYYLHLNARILGQAEQLGQDTLLTICNVCTLNLRQADRKLKDDPELLARVNDNLREVGAATYSGGVEVRHLLWEIAEGEGYERLKQVASKPLTGLRVAPFYGCQILRPSKLLGFEDPDRPESLERIIEACGAEPVDYPSKIQLLRVPDRAGPRGGRAGRADPAAGGGQGGGRRRDRHAVPALPPVARRLAGQGVARGRPGVRPADPPSGAAGRRGRRAVLRRAPVQAARGQGGPRGPQDLRRALIRAGWLRATQHSCARRTGRC